VTPVPPFEWEQSQPTHTHTHTKKLYTAPALGKVDPREKQDPRGQMKRGGKKEQDARELLLRMKTELEAELADDEKKARRKKRSSKKKVNKEDPRSNQDWRPFLTAWGDGSSQQLTGKPVKSRCKLDPIAVFPLVEKQIRGPWASSIQKSIWKGIHCGRHATYCWTLSGKLYSWGSGNALGRTPSDRCWSVPGFGGTFHTAVNSVSTGEDHVVCTTVGGRIYTWGLTMTGALGLGESSRKPSPTQIPFFQKRFVTKVSAGANHTAVVTMAQELYTFGEGRAGQLGHGDVKNRNRPCKVEALCGVIFVACGSNHTLIGASSLRSTGYHQLFATGHGEYGRLGTGKEHSQNIPTLIEKIPDNLTLGDMSAGSAHNLVLDGNGDVYAFGWNQYGQCAISPLEQVVLHPQKISSLSRITQVSAGFAHSIVLGEDGTIFAFGFGEQGQLGIGSEVSSSEPCMVDKLSAFRALNISAGWCHNGVLCEKKGLNSDKLSWRKQLQQEKAACKILRFLIRCTFLRDSSEQTQHSSSSIEQPGQHSAACLDHAQQAKTVNIDVGKQKPKQGLISSIEDEAYDEEEPVLDNGAHEGFHEASLSFLTQSIVLVETNEDMQYHSRNASPDEDNGAADSSFFLTDSAYCLDGDDSYNKDVAGDLCDQPVILSSPVVNECSSTVSAIHDEILLDQETTSTKFKHETPAHKDSLRLISQPISSGALSSSLIEPIREATFKAKNNSSANKEKSINKLAVKNPRSSKSQGSGMSSNSTLLKPLGRSSSQQGQSFSLNDDINKRIAELDRCQSYIARPTKSTQPKKKKHLPPMVPFTT